MALAPAQELFVAGTGSFAAEVADWARAAGLRVVGLVELIDQSRIGTIQHGLPVVALASVQISARVVLGMGGDRREIWQRLDSHDWSPMTVIHPGASLAHDVRLGSGATIGPLAVIGAASGIGEQAIVSRGALVGHHVEVRAYATLNPGVNVAGNTIIGERAFIGMSATVVNGVRVGDGAVIAAGAVVVRDVEADTRVQGVPARPVPASAP